MVDWTDSLDFIDREQDVAACYPLMQQLRPHLTGLEEFLARWRRQVGDGYRLLAVRRDGRPVALAGFRVQENLIHGRFLYVDDLVTDETRRGSGLGQRLIERLKEEARALGCARLVLDTAMGNALGHRFYYRQGLLAHGLRFSMPIA
jgi:GNAT superfamily N-acetyltransferase